VNQATNQRLERCGKAYSLCIGAVMMIVVYLSVYYSLFWMIFYMWVLALAYAAIFKPFKPFIYASLVTQIFLFGFSVYMTYTTIVNAQSGYPGPIIAATLLANLTFCLIILDVLQLFFLSRLSTVQQSHKYIQMDQIV